MSSQPRLTEITERLVPAAYLPRAEEVSEYSEDLNAFVSSLWRRRTAFLLGFVPVVLAAGAYLYFVTPEYTATATLVLDPRKQVVITSPDVLQDLSADSTVIDTQVKLLGSRAVLALAAQELGPRPQPDPAKDVVYTGPLAPLFQQVQAFIRPPSPASAPATTNDIVDDILYGLDVARIDLTMAIQISYTSDDPEYSATVANAVADAYRRYQTELKLQATKDANAWLNKQVAELRDRVEQAESAVAEYRSHAGLLTAKGATSAESEISNLDGSLNEAQQSLNAARATLQGYESALDRSGVAEAAKIVATPAMQQLRSQYTDLSNQLAQLSSTLGPKHPQIMELKGRVDSLRGEMYGEARRTIQQLMSDVAIAEQRVQGIESIRDQSRTQLAQENASTVELAQLQANAQSLRMLYDDMLTRLQQTTAQESRNQINATVVSEAVPPSSASSPRRGLIISGALVMGTAIGVLLMMLRQLLDRTVVNPRELERRTRLPVLALVPKLRWRDLRLKGRRLDIAHYVANKPFSLFAEAFRNLRVSVRRPRSDETTVVQITSGASGEGKTICSLAFAQAAALDGRRVLLIDADVRRRSLTEAMGITVSAGLLELLRGEATLDEVLLPGVDRSTPHIIPLSMALAGPHDRFYDRAFRLLLQTLKQSFDLIIIDSAPVLAIAEALTLSRHADAVVIVARWARTPLETVAKARESIERAGGNVAGLLLTHVDVESVMKQTYGRKHYPSLMQYYQK
ncbi:MAG: polysaccharide biosynthesis tyrosine autokinase [Steroidobacteraceae bacterium]